MAGAGSEHFEFRGAGAVDGLEIWRIEAMAPVRWCVRTINAFYYYYDLLRSVRVQEADRRRAAAVVTARARDV